MDQATRDRLEQLAIGQRRILARLISLDMRVRALAASQKPYSDAVSQLAMKPSSTSHVVEVARPVQASKPQVEKVLFSRKDAAFALSISLRSLDGLVASKEIAFRRMGRKVMIPATEVKRVSRQDNFQL